MDCAVILAVGSPAHQSQLTYNRPRAMLPALGRPLVVRMMDRLYRSGIQEYTVVVGEDDGSVASYLNAHWAPDVKVNFVFHATQDSLLKTLGKIAREYRQPFVITSYNSFIHPNFPERLTKHYHDYGDELMLSGAATTLSRGQNHYFALTDDHRVSEITTEVTAGQQALTLTDLALCGQRFVDFLAAQSERGTGLLHRELMQVFRYYVGLGMPTFVTETAWTLQVETDDDLLTLQKHLLDEEQDAHILSELPASVQVVPPVRIDPQVSVGQGATIGPYVYLESGCSVGHKAVVRNSLILNRAAVGAGETVSNVIVSTRARIQA
jgi:NDP-sugar pyrophosphorylase family protein